WRGGRARTPPIPGRCGSAVAAATAAVTASAAVRAVGWPVGAVLRPSPQRVGQRRVASTADARSGTERAPRGAAPGGGAAAPAGAPAAARRAAGGARGGRRRRGRGGGHERWVVLLVPVVALVVGVALIGPTCARARRAGAGGGYARATGRGRA